MKNCAQVIALLVTTSLFCHEITAQVGINTDIPEQALDVNGKLKVGDDTTTPTEGTLRYNATTKTFEGFDGSAWIKLNNDGTEHSFKITRSSNFTISGGFSTNVPMDLVEFNNGNCIIQFSSQFFLAPVSGRYQLNLIVNICSAASIGGINADLNKVPSGGGSTENLARYVLSRTEASSNQTFHIATTVDLQEGDRITILFGNAGSSTDDIIFCGNSTINAIELSGFLIK